MIDVPFVGRRAALKFLHEQLQLASAQGTRLVLLPAPAGAGKTALVHHFLKEVEPAVCRVEGRGWDNQAATSYYPLRQALRQLPRKGEIPAYIQAFLDGPQEEEDLSFPPQTLFPNLSRFLRQQAPSSLLCFFLDDLQWADEGTFEWLDFALREMAGAPLLWVGAYRSEDAGSLASLLSHRPRWLRDGQLGEYLLEPLARAEVEELLQRAMPEGQWNQELLEEIWQRSEGLALFVIEEIRACLEGEGSASCGRVLIAERLGRLSPAERQILQQAAAVGERFDVSPLAATLGREEYQLVQTLETLRCEKGLLVEDGMGYRFVHSRYREALLDSMSPALKQALHARLSEQIASLPPLERTYHLVHSGDTEAAIENLLEMSEKVLYTANWRDALRLCVEALWLVRDVTSHPSLLASIYQQIGDLQFFAAHEPEIACGYYETALHWAQTPRKRALLLCRLAEVFNTYAKRFISLRYLDTAEGLLAEEEDESLRAWVRFRRATYLPPMHLENRKRRYELAQVVGAVPDLPQDMLLEPYYSRLVYPATSTRDPEVIRQQARETLALARDSYTRARLHWYTARAYWFGGVDTAESLRHLFQARTLFEKIGRLDNVMDTYDMEAEIALSKGAYAACRAVCEKALSLSAGAHISTTGLHKWLCKTWIYDRTEAGAVWAAQLLDHLFHLLLYQPFFQRHTRYLVHRLGLAEWVLCGLGQEQSFREQIEKGRRQLRNAGHDITATWYLHEQVELEELDAVSAAEGWDPYVPSPESGLSCEAGRVHCVALAIHRFADLDVPRLTHRVRGDFALEATVHPGWQVLAGILECRRRKALDQTAFLAPGSGGLMAVRDTQNALRLCAHHCGPSDVLFEVYRDGEYFTPERGLLEDGQPIRLRLERRGATFRAYAGNVEGPWYRCGQAELPGWDEVEIGLYGESTFDCQSSVVQKVETYLWDIRLQSEAHVPGVARGEDAIYPLPQPRYEPDLLHLVFSGRRLQQVLGQVRQAARADKPLFITGETGTGKETIARARHQLSSRAAKPFVRLNCAAIAPDLFERELFGYVRAAFSTAPEGRGGLLEAASGGALFLDEIGEAPPELQARLLQIFERKCDVQLITASQQDLQSAMREGRFRRDLYFRLRSTQIDLPPLRRQREAVPFLVAHVLAHWADQRKMSPPRITRQAMEQLLSHSWPGNVRELIQEVERAAEETKGQLITARHLSFAPLPATAAEEAARIREALKETQGNVAAASRRLHISRTTLYRKMRRFHLTRQETTDKSR